MTDKKGGVSPVQNLRAGSFWHKEMVRGIIFGTRFGTECLP